MKHVSPATGHQASERLHNRGDQTHFHLARVVPGNGLLTLKMELLQKSEKRKNQGLGTIPLQSIATVGNFTGAKKS